MDVEISWKKASKCFQRTASNETLKWRGVTKRRAGMWWGDRTALEDAFSAFFSLLLFFHYGCWCYWVTTSCCVWFSQVLLFWRNVPFCEISNWLTFSHSRGSLLIPGDSIIPWTLPTTLLARLEHVWEMWTSVFAMLYPDMSLRCIVCRITKETTCEQGNPLPVFGKSSVLLDKHFPAWDLVEISRFWTILRPHSSNIRPNALSLLHVCLKTANPNQLTSAVEVINPFCCHSSVAVKGLCPKLAALGLLC